MLRTVIAYLRRHHVALVALVFAAGGTAYAANEIGTKNIKDHSIRSVDVRDGALRGADIKPNSIGSKHLRANAAYPVSSALIIDDGSGGVDLEDADGFTRVERTGTGSYVLTFADSNPVCSIATTPIVSTTGDTYPPVSITGEGGEGQTLRVITANAQGEPADLGADFGYVGFTIMGTC